MATPLLEMATPLPISVVPSKNSTVPEVAPVTVAIISTDWPKDDVLG